MINLYNRILLKQIQVKIQIIVCKQLFPDLENKSGVIDLQSDYIYLN